MRTSNNSITTSSNNAGAITTTATGNGATGGSRRDTWCPTDSRRALLDASSRGTNATNNNNDDDDNDDNNDDDDKHVESRVSALQRVHDGDTIDLGVVMRSAQLEADRAVTSSSSNSKQPSSSSTATTTTTKPRESDLQLWMLPQKVANEIVAMRKELADATSRLDEATNAARSAESKLAQVINRTRKYRQTFLLKYIFVHL